MSGENPTLARSIGRFFGHILAAARHRPRPGNGARVVRVELRERTVDTPRGPLLLRRTTIDEVCRPVPGDQR
jgi:hypothetical protein